MLKQHGGGFGPALSTTAIKCGQGAMPSLIVWVWVRSGKGVRDSKGQFCTRKCITDSVDLGTCTGSARITGQPDVGRSRERSSERSSGANLTGRTIHL